MTTRSDVPTTSGRERIEAPSRAGLYAPFLIGLAVLLTWGGYWLHVAQTMQRDLRASLARLEAAGFTFATGMSDVHGFPYRFSVDFAPGRVTHASQDLSIRHEGFRLTTLPFDTDHVVAEFGEQIDIAWKQQELTVALVEARLGWQPIDKRRPKTSGLDVGLKARQMDVSLTPGGPFARLRLDNATLNARPGATGEDTLRLFAEISGGELGADWAGGPLLGNQIGPALLAAELQNAAKFAQTPQLSGMRARVLAAEVDYGAFDLSLTGAIELVNAPETLGLSPIETGHVIVTVRNPERLKNGLAGLGINPRGMDLMGLLDLMRDVPTARTQRFDWRDGGLWWGMVRIGPEPDQTHRASDAPDQAEPVQPASE